MSTELPTDHLDSCATANGPHNPCREAMQERVVRQIRTLRVMRRELETGLRPLLLGHAGGNPWTRPRSDLRVTAPVPDPTSTRTVAFKTMMVL
jgi:hypothetical protein